MPYRDLCNILRFPSVKVAKRKRARERAGVNKGCEKGVFASICPTNFGTTLQLFPNSRLAPVRPPTQPYPFKKYPLILLTFSRESPHGALAVSHRVSHSPLGNGTRC
jgi:hypothetical protein